NRHLNIHPSLLPAFRGLGTHAKVLAAGVKITGCTVHVVREAMDAGPIVTQAAVVVEPGDTEQTLAARVLKAEHRLYPWALDLVASGRARIEGERLIFGEQAGAEEPPLFSPPLLP
ncbi:MAG: phosphoribosylglycinamide formyltransferase, partial [Alphaproteobacteria bacterium]